MLPVRLHGLLLRVRTDGVVSLLPLVPLWHVYGHLYISISVFNKNCANNILK
jgi:hypothetical protein